MMNLLERLSKRSVHPTHLLNLVYGLMVRRARPTLAYRQCHIMAARSSRFSDFKAINRLLRAFRQCPLSVGTIKN